MLGQPQRFRLVPQPWAQEAIRAGDSSLFHPLTLRAKRLEQPTKLIFVAGYGYTRQHDLDRALPSATMMSARRRDVDVNVSYLGTRKKGQPESGNLFLCGPLPGSQRYIAHGLAGANHHGTHAIWRKSLAGCGYRKKIVLHQTAFAIGQMPVITNEVHAEFDTDLRLG